MISFDLAITPVLKASLDTDEAGVTVTTYNRLTGATVSQSSSTATQDPAASGRWKWSVAFSSPPTYGLNQYSTKFVGTTYGQVVWIEWDWSWDRAKYKGGVHLDTTGGGTAGTAYPTGTDFQPVSNLADAITIASRINTKVIRLNGLLTLAQSVAGYSFEGVGAKESNIITLGGQDVTATMFTDVTLTGTQGTGLCYTYGCWLNGITGLNMHAEFAKLYGAFTMAMTGQFACANGKAQGTSPITFDMNVVSGVGIVEADGIFVFSNLGHPSGYIAVTGNHNTTVMSSVTAGTIIFAGLGDPTILGTPSLYINQTIPDAFFNAGLTEYTTVGTGGHALATMGFSGKVWINTSTGNAGTAYPIGTQFYPVSNITDALTIAAVYNFNKIYIMGDVTLGAAVDGYIFEGENYSVSSLDLNNQSANGCTFTNLTLSGQVNSTGIYTVACYLDSMTNFVGSMDSCTIGDSITKKAAAAVSGTNCNIFSTTGTYGVIDFQNSAGNFAMMGLSGWADIQNFNDAAAVLYFSGDTVNVNLGATVLKGTAIFTGSGNIIGATGRTLLNVAEFTKTNVDGVPGELNVVNQFVPMAVADIYADNHQDAGTVAKVISTIAANVGTPVALDGGSATVSGMLTKLADDNGGASFDAETDSLNKVRDKVDALNNITAADVWAAGTRTLTGFGTLVADIATAVWTAAVRTLSAFGFTQEVRDSMKLAPSGGDPAAGSIDESLTAVVSAVDDMYDVSLGTWSLQTPNLLIFYRPDGTTEIARFSCYDIDDNPTLENIARVVRI